MMMMMKGYVPLQQQRQQYQHVPQLQRLLVVFLIIQLQHIITSRISTTSSSILLVNALPIGFIEEGVASVDAMTGAFAPNPRNTNQPMLLVSSKEGLIHVIENPDHSDTVILIGDFTNRTCFNGERGVQTIRPHPNFDQNQYIFIYYTHYNDNCLEDPILGPSNRLSRFTINNSTLQIIMESEIIYLETPPAVRVFHNGGSMLIGNDHYLYITTGDGGSREPPYAQDLTKLYGKVLRIDLNGNIPITNPFRNITKYGFGVPCRYTKGQPPINSPNNSICEEIFSYGLRNPFRMTLDINNQNNNNNNKTRFVIGDVGGSVWEEINEGGSDYAGKNYGWPVFEGPCSLGKTNRCPQQNITLSDATEPFYYYQHTQTSAGGAITGSAFVPNGLWPNQYKFLFIDHIYNEMYNLIFDNNRACRNCTPPIPAYRNETFYNFPRMVDMFFGSYNNTKALYVVSMSTAGQNIRRIRYTGIANQGPNAVITVNATKTVRNVNLLFKGDRSTDPDNDTLTYYWNFGDGTNSTIMNPIKSYTKFGEYKVTLTVTDSLDQTSQTYTTIIVGTRPKAFIETCKNGQKFYVGQVLRLRGNATDFKGNTIPSTRMFWQVRLHHATHYHPFLDNHTGNDFDLYPAPSPEDLPAILNSYLEVIYTVVDINGITRTVTCNLVPRKVIISIDSIPSGLEVLVDETALMTPTNLTTWLNQTLRLNVFDQGQYIFSSWNIGGSRRTFYTIPIPIGGRQKIIAIMKNNTT